MLAENNDNGSERDLTDHFPVDLLGRVCLQVCLTGETSLRSKSLATARKLLWDWRACSAVLAR